VRGGEAGREEAGEGEGEANEERNRKGGRHLAAENAVCTLIICGWEDGACAWGGKGGECGREEEGESRGSALRPRDAQARVRAHTHMWVCSYIIPARRVQGLGP
jgi:hypothetical protein